MLSGQRRIERITVIDAQHIRGVHCHVSSGADHFSLPRSV
jgi:hypothetical protein